MGRISLRASDRAASALFGTAIISLVVLIILFPHRAFQASLYGLNIWWEILFPSLLPVFVLTEMLFALGIVRALGVLADPFMRLIFRLPGECGWAFAAGLLAGYPAGADVAGKLYQRNLLTLHETARIVAMSHIAGPMWVFTAISVGFLHRSELGAVLIAAQIAAALAIGIAGRLFTREQDSPSPTTNRKEALLSRCLSAIRESRREDGRAFGKILGDSVASAVQTLFVIGGTMMIASVLLEMLRMAGSYELLLNFLIMVFHPVGFPEQWAVPLLTGLVEVNLGVFAIGKDNTAPLFAQSALTAFLLAWSGFAVHAQVRSLPGIKGLRYFAFVRSRLIHAVLAFIAALLLYDPITQWTGSSPSVIKVFRMTEAGGIHQHPLLFSHWHLWFISAALATAWLFVLIGCSGVIRMFGRDRPE